LLVWMSWLWSLAVLGVIKREGVEGSNGSSVHVLW
jgi:hypothetical protein